VTRDGGQPCHETGEPVAKEESPTNAARDGVEKEGRDAQEGAGRRNPAAPAAAPLPSLDLAMSVRKKTRASIFGGLLPVYYTYHHQMT